MISYKHFVTSTSNFWYHKNILWRQHLISVVIKTFRDVILVLWHNLNILWSQHQISDVIKTLFDVTSDIWRYTNIIYYLQYITHLEEFSIRPELSTTLALTKLTHKLSQNLNINLKSAFLFLGVEKAFDHI